MLKMNWIDILIDLNCSVNVWIFLYLKHKTTECIEQSNHQISFMILRIPK